MEFVDDAIVLRARPHGETHAVVDLFTAQHGRRAGLVYGGQGRKAGALLQPGNGVRATWRGRGDESLGAFALELTAARASAAIGERLSLAALTACCAVALAALPEREPMARVFQAQGVLLDHLHDPDVWPALMARWELGLLAALGFGLALDHCAATGAREDLAFVSPKSGAAVSRSAGEPYRDRLFPLPAFLTGSGAASRGEMIDALEITGHFLEARALHPAGIALPGPRVELAALLKAS